jgi:hypothetical protein
LGAVICRCKALTMPLVSDPSRPKGLPIATTACPTTTLLELASVSGRRSDAGASTFSTARSLDASVPTTVASYVESFENLTETVSAPSTTCAFVMMWPSRSETKPEPCAVCAPPPGPNPEPLELTVISTTDLAARL